jgi:hypothetical protein
MLLGMLCAPWYMGGHGCKNWQGEKKDKWQTKGKSCSSLFAVTALITMGYVTLGHNFCCWAQNNQILCKLLKCMNELSYSSSSLSPTKWLLQCHTPFCRNFGSFMSPLQGITSLLSPSTTTCWRSCIPCTSILLHGFVMQDAGLSFPDG